MDHSLKPVEILMPFEVSVALTLHIRVLLLSLLPKIQCSHSRHLGTFFRQTRRLSQCLKSLKQCLGSSLLNISHLAQ